MGERGCQRPIETRWATSPQAEARRQQIQLGKTLSEAEPFGDSASLNDRLGRTQRLRDTSSTDFYDYYYNQQWQVLEVRKNGSVNPWKQYVYHPQYVDAIAVRYYDANTSGTGIVEHYYLQDANFNVTAVVDNTGTVKERYAYTPYGEVTVLDADFSSDADNKSDISNELLYTGRRRDPETGLQLNRNRFYAAGLGRWVNRDPADYFDSYNLYQYVLSNPTGLLDASGLGCKVCYNCVLVSSTGGWWKKQCEYSCSEDPSKKRDLKQHGGCNCEDPRIPKVITEGETVRFGGTCRLTYDTCQDFTDPAVDLRNCSRKKCKRDWKARMKKLKKTCSLIPDPIAKRACKAAIRAMTVAMEETCNSCKNP